MTGFPMKRGTETVSLKVVKLPAGEYVTEGDTYRVSVGRHDVRFENVSKPAHPILGHPGTHMTRRAYDRHTAGGCFERVAG